VDDERSGRHDGCSEGAHGDPHFVAAPATMHTVFFGLKRAHHSVLRTTRRALARLGLTAARFDLLYAVHERAPFGQMDLCRALGVSAPTVSRMLASLEELGLIRREVGCPDRRCRVVMLTNAGLRCVRRAIRRLMLSGAAQLLVDSALCPDHWHDKGICARASKVLEDSLDAVRFAFGDLANLYRPWTPDRDEDYPVVTEWTSSRVGR
jgi:DNA-binding MarR family transcriptional regulator